MGFFEQLFKPKTRPFMGVDISEERIKLLELDSKAGAYRVLGHASESLPSNAVTDHQIADPEAVATAVTRALERSGSRTREAAIAVSGPTVISKIIDMPAGLSDEEIEQQIGLDAERYIPHAIEEVNLDFQVLERDSDNADVDRVLLVACRRDNIETRVGALEMAGMSVALVDVEEYVLQNACTLLVNQMPGLAGDTSVAVFDLGAQRTRLNIQRGIRSVYSRELSFGGQGLASAIMSRHSLNDLAQLRAHLRTGEIDGTMLADDIADFASRATSQIERALQFYSSAAEQDETIDQVLLTGGPTVFPGVEDAMRERLNWPVAVGNPLAGMLASGTARRNHVDAEGPALMIAAGLAMRAVQ